MRQHWISSTQKESRELVYKLIDINKDITSEAKTISVPVYPSGYNVQRSLSLIFLLGSVKFPNILDEVFGALLPSILMHFLSISILFRVKQISGVTINLKALLSEALPQDNQLIDFKLFL